MDVRRHLTFANIAASLSLVLACSGTAYAAATLTGANIKDNTLTGKDVKNASLSTSDLQAATVSRLKGATGAKGDVGPKGDDGPAGPAGSPAKVVVSFASEDSGAYTSPSTANVNGEDWFAYDQGGAAGPDALTGISAPEVDFGPFTSVPFLIGLTDGSDPGGYLNVNFDAAISATASVTLLHRGTVHTRAECQLWGINIDDGSQFAMGDAVYVSSNTNNELVSVSAVGSKDVTVASGTKRYDVQVRCRDADRTTMNGDKWEYARGNLTAFAASQN